jgi:holo-[acyl-carrier protein] synthase
MLMSEVIPPYVGVDLLEPKRLQARIERTRTLTDDLFTPGEQAYCFAQQFPYQHLAARFCAKEATAKALGLDGFDPLEIEVVNGGPSAELVLHGSVKSRAKSLNVRVSASLSHLKGIAAAVVLASPITTLRRTRP